MLELKELNYIYNLTIYNLISHADSHIQFLIDSVELKVPHS